MKEKPLVSIGIPAYNRPDSLKKTLCCITSQTYHDLEIVVSDDCSSNTDVGKVILEAMSSDARIRFYRQEHNLGAVSNMEFVLNESTGKYFIWADDEDICEPEFVEKLVDCMEDHPDMAVCACDVRIVDQQDNFIKVERLERIRSNTDWRRVQRHFFRYPTTNIYLCVLGMFRTKQLKACNVRNIEGWKGYTSNGEVPLLAELATVGKIAAIPEMLKTYRFNPDSVYHSEQRSIPWLDHFMLRLTIRLRLCKIALASKEPVVDKLLLLGTVLSSLIISVVRGHLGSLKRFAIKLFTDRRKRLQS